MREMLFNHRSQSRCQLLIDLGKRGFFLLFIFFLSGVKAQSDWRYKPYVIVNDTMIIQVKHPVFIMDSTLYIRSKEGKHVMTFPSKDVNYISKRCFYDRLGEGQKNRLANSSGTSAYIAGTLLFTGSIFLGIGIDDLLYYLQTPGAQSFYGSSLFTGFIMVVPAALMIRSMIIKKLRTRMIIESKGIRLTQNIGNENPMNGFGLSATKDVIVTFG